MKWNIPQIVADYQSGMSQRSIAAKHHMGHDNVVMVLREAGVKPRSPRMFQPGDKTNLRHGHALAGNPSPAYRAWQHMLNRCFSKANRAYCNYGGRGITVCERWLTFENFLKDMGEKPRKDLSIDRINNDGNYEPGNCRWATAKEQRNNQRPMKPRQRDAKGKFLSKALYRDPRRGTL